MITCHRLAAFALAFFLAASCVHAAGPLAGSEWRPLEIAGVAVPAEPEMFLRFGGDGKLAGNGGCNGFFGTYKLDGDAIAFGPIGATRRACEDPVMDREMALLAALEKVATYARDRIDLELRDAGGNVLLRLRQTDAD